MGIKQRLVQAIDSWEWRTVDPLLAHMLCRDALEEIERQAEVIRTLGVELDIASAAVRAEIPEVAQLTRHTIALQKPLPAMDVGDSLLLVIVPPR
jgi:hypothetical protein